MSAATLEAPRQAAPLPVPAEFLTNQDAARWLGVSPERLRQSRSTGTLCGRPAPAFLRLGTRSRVRYKVETLRAWLVENATEHTPQPATAGQ